jgi:preprotein translocase subunit SecF
MTKGFDYKLLVIVPILLIMFSIAVLGNNYMQTGEWFQRDIDLKSGTVITVNSGSVDIDSLKGVLELKFGSVNIREFRGFSGTGISVEFDSEIDSSEVLTELKNQGIDTKDSSIQSISPALGEAFWSQAQIGIILAFIIMGFIVFILFRTFVPSMAVILSAASDILVTLAFMQIFGIKISLAGLAAVLMLIGYSVDTDILLTSRLLKSRGKTLTGKIKSAFNTGITMTGTSIAALTAILLSSISPVLSTIASILLIGLFADIVMTWFQNAVILRWYCERRHIGED